MPSPFPGMDPYLEAPHIWPDFHHRLADDISSVLNESLPATYYAQMESRPEVGIVDSEERPRRVVPDVVVVESHAAQRSSSTTAVLDERRTDLSEFIEVDASVEPLRHHYVEIRDASQNHKLITLIEIVSPSNKRRGKDRDAYVQKQEEVLASDASLVEIDLLRSGERLLAGSGLEEWIQQSAIFVDYLAVVNRAWRRDKFRLYPRHIRQALPVIGIPLREAESEVPLDLQFAVNRAYDRGPYRRGAVDYGQPPTPALRDEDAIWAAELLKPILGRSAL